MFLPDISIKRPVFATMMISAMIVFGIIGYTRLGVDQFPKTEYPVVTITTTLLGASPEVMEEDVTDIIEEEVNTIQGIKSLTSVSATGASLVTLEFDLDRDIDLAAQDVRDKVAGAVRRLPKDIDPSVVDKLDLQAQPIIWVAVSGERPIQEVTEYAKETVKKRLETISGVGSILMGGRRERKIRIWLDSEKLAGYGLTSLNVKTALGRENIEIPGGRIESRAIEFNIVTEGEVKRVGDFNELIIAQRNGVPIRIRDVGYIEDGLEDKRTAARYRGDPAVGLGIRKQSGANTVEVARRVKETLENIKQTLPPGIKLDISFDSSVFIEDSIKEVQFALIVGAGLACAVVFFFLLSLRSTIFIAFAIPTSLIATFGFVYFLGFTINTMTLLALTLSTGMVVDDAIIILENIFRHRKSEPDPLKAARLGASEIGFAAMASTFAIVAVFIPVAFMKDVSGRFFYEFGITVAVANLLSLFVSLTLTPMLCSRYLKIEEGVNPVFRAIEKGYSLLESGYRRLLALSLAHRALVILLAIGLFYGSLKLMGFMGSEFIPPEDQSRMIIRFETPVGSSIEYTEGMLREIEDRLRKLPEARSFFGAIGLSASGTQVNKGILFTRLIGKEKRERSQHEIMAFLRKDLNQIPGVRVYIEDIAQGFGAQRGAPLEFYITGPTLEGLEQYSAAIMKKLKEVPGIVDVNSNLDLRLPEARIFIDRERASALGLDVASIASEINTMMAGEDVTKYKEKGKRYDVRVKLIPDQRTRPIDIDRIMVRNSYGVLVKLSNVVSIETGIGPNVINRRDRQRAVTIFANLEGRKDLGSAVEDVKRIAGDLLPSEYNLNLSGRAKLQQESMRSLAFALILSIIIAYMILASQFDSYIHSLTVLLSLPLSIIGAIGVLWLTENTINIFSVIGIILLTGIVKKNSILLVDYTNTLRERGMERNEAVLTASPVRLRPILMTSLSTIFGVLPTAVGIGPGSETRAPMAIAIAGGMLTSTLLPLFAVPVVYTIFDDLASLKFIKLAQEINGKIAAIPSKMLKKIGFFN